MANNKMDIDGMIERLNKSANVSQITVNKIEDFHLGEAEESFIKKYRPENSLIIYGSLAPGKSNHYMVEHIRGDWCKGLVRGKLEKEGWGADMGYYGFRHVASDEQTEIEAFIFSSDEMIANWPRLDEFEGEEYRRILAKYELEHGEIGVGYIYAINEKTLLSKKCDL